MITSKFTYYIFLTTIFGIWVIYSLHDIGMWDTFKTRKSFHFLLTIILLPTVIFAPLEATFASSATNLTASRKLIDATTHAAVVAKSTVKMETGLIVKIAIDISGAKCVFTCTNTKHRQGTQLARQYTVAKTAGKR